MVFFVSLLNFIFEIFIYVFLLRIIYQRLNASWTNPISQWIVRLSEPVVKYFRRFLPGIKGYDLSIIVPMFILQIIEIYILFGIKIKVAPGFLGVLLMSVAYIGYKLINIYFWCIIATAVASWLVRLKPEIQHNSFLNMLQIIANPPLALAQRFVPLVGGIDFSPIVLLLVLWLIKWIVFNSVLQLAWHWAY